MKWKSCIRCFISCLLSVTGLFILGIGLCTNIRIKYYDYYYNIQHSLLIQGKFDYAVVELLCVCWTFSFALEPHILFGFLYSRVFVGKTMQSVMRLDRFSCRILDIFVDLDILPTQHYEDIVSKNDKINNTKKKK